jgi:hypothetical protein
MPINPSIAMGVQPLQLADPLAQYGKISAIQSAQNQNALAQYQLSAAQREDATANALNEAYKNAYNTGTGEVDVNKLRQSLATGGFGAKLPGIEKSLAEMESAKTKSVKERTELVDSKLKQSRAFLENIDPSDPNAPQMYLQWHKANHADPIIGPVLAARGVTADQSMNRIQQAISQGPQAFAQLLNESKLGTEKFMELNKPQISTRNLGATTETSLISPLTGKVQKIAAEVNTIAPADAKRIAQEGQRIGLEGRRVAVMEEENRLKKDPVFQQTMAAAKATGEAIAKGEVAAKQALPGVIANAQEAVNLVDQMIGKQEVRDAKTGKVIQSAASAHPGFENAVGTTWKPGFRFIPGTDAADFQALFEQVKGSAFLEAFNTLKGAGAISEKEGEKATAARTRMSTAQSESEFVKAAREYQDVIRKGVEVMQKKAGSAPAAAGGAVDTSNPLLK